MIRRRVVRVALGVLSLAAAWAGLAVVAAHAQDFSQVPVKGMVTLIDLGADQCVPCKMMAPILTKLKQEYKDRAAIVFIDVWKKESRPSVSGSGPSRPRSSSTPAARRSPVTSGS